MFGLFGNSGEREASKILGQQAGQLQQSYNPYIQMGQRQGPELESLYSGLRSNPQEIQQMLGGGYQQSPGYQFQYNQAMNGINNAAAAGGYAGNPAHQYQAGQLAQGLANQDYWKYYGANQDLFNQGLSGTQGLYNQGYTATNDYSTNLGANQASRAGLAYTGEQNRNNRISSLLGAGIGATGYALGGPLGGMAAKGLSNWFMPGQGG